MQTAQKEMTSPKRDEEPWQRGHGRKLWHSGIVLSCGYVLLKSGCKKRRLICIFIYIYIYIGACRNPETVGK